MGNASKRHRPREGKRAIIYTRQSTSREESISLELQEETCRAYASRNGYRVVKTISDPGISGLEFDKRPGIQETIELVKANAADVIVVWELSRVSREEFDQVFIDREVERAGGRIESATEPNGSWESKKLNQFVSALDSKQKSRRWKEAQARRIKMGLPAGGAPPLGYAKNDTGGRFVPDSTYGPVVVEMYDMYLRGIGPAGIAKVLNDPARKLSAPRGGRFSVATIVRALDSGFAAGYIMRHGERVEGAHEPLIDDATWQRYLQERERRREQNPNPKSRQPRWFLGAGLAVCGRCNGHMVVDSYRSQKSQAICSTYRSNAPGACQGAWVDRRKLETVVALWLGGHVEEWANAAEAQAGSTDDERGRLVQAIDVERAAKTKVEEGLRTAQRLVARGAMTEDDFIDRKREVDAELREVTARLGDLQSRLDALDPAGDAYDRLARALGRADDGVPVTQPLDVAVPFDVPDGVVWPTEQVPAMPPEEWHALLRRIIKRVVVDKWTVVIEPWNGEPKTIDRGQEMPPRRRRDAGTQTRDASTGRFVKTTA